jgi:hypothetical protein
MGLSRSIERVDDSTPLDLNDVHTWTTEDVARWLKENKFNQFIDKFVTNDVDGEALMLLNQESLERMGVTVGAAAKIIKRLHPSPKTEKDPIDDNQTNDKPEKSPRFSTPPPTDRSRSLSNSSSPSSNRGRSNSATPQKYPNTPQSPQEIEKLVQMGMKKMEKVKGWKSLSLEQQKLKVRNLVVRDALIKAYFDTNYVATRKLTIDINETATCEQPEEQEEKKQIQKMIDQVDEIEDEKVDTSIVDANKDKRSSISAAEIIELNKIARKTQLHVGREEFLKVKLVIVEIHNTTSTRTLRRMLTPIMDTFNISPQFGMFHSALVVGPWYLEWNDSSLIVPRKCYAGAAVLAADVDKFFKGPQVNEAIDRITRVICDWNSNKQYSQYGVNCQHFVDELCKVLEINLEFKGALGNFIQELRKTGQCELEYTLTPELQKILGVDYSRRRFKTHRELDDFVTMVRTKSPLYYDIDPVGKDDWILLKSFDRGFWLRHFKNLDAVEHQPHECPFSNPTVSGSLAPNFFTYKRNAKKYLD